MVIIISAILGIVFYNLVCTIIMYCTNEDDTISIHLCYGIIDGILYIAEYIWSLYKKVFWRALIKDNATGKIYYCKCKNYDDFLWTVEKSYVTSYGGNYKGIKRHCFIKEWIKYSPVTAKMLEEVTNNNCNYCIHDDVDCFDSKPLCKCNEWGYVAEYTNFERK